MSVDWDHVCWLVFQIQYEGQQGRYMTVSIPTDDRLPIEESVRMLTESGAVERRVDQRFGDLPQLSGRTWKVIGHVPMTDEQHVLMFPEENAEIRRAIRRS